MKKNARILTAIGALIALAALTHRIGVRNVAAQLHGLSIVLPIVLFAGFIRLLLQTRAWRIALRADGVDVPQARLFGIRLASQAAGYMTVLGPAVSEPAKLVMLRDRAEMADAAPATLAETGAYWLTTVVLGLVGTCAAAFLITNARLIWGAMAIFGVALAFLVTRRSLLTPLVRFAGSGAPRWLRSAEELDLSIRSFRDRRPKAARTVLILDAIGQIVTLLEVATVLWIVGFRFSLAQVLAIEAAGRMVKILGSWIPGRIGADEGGAAASFALLGLPAATGLMLAVARRLRDVTWCLIGVLWITLAANRLQEEKSRPEILSLCPEGR